MKSAFLDTMLYLHYKPVEQIAWLDLLDADKVTIVVPRITIQELDKHKNTHPSRRIRDRAARVLRSIESWLAHEPATIRDGVAVEYHPRFPADFDKDLGLNPHWADDVLVASILDYQATHLPRKVVLITQDTGPRLTARGAGIDVVALPDDLRLPEEPDEMERENRELRRRLQKLEAATPQLELRIRDTSPSHVLQVPVAPDVPFSEERLEARIQQLRKTYPRSTRVDTALGVLLVPDQSEYDRYDNELANFLWNTNGTYAGCGIRKTPRDGASLCRSSL